MEQLQILAAIQKTWPKLSRSDFIYIIEMLEQSAPPPRLPIRQVYRKVKKVARQQQLLDQAISTTERLLAQDKIRKLNTMVTNETDSSTLSELQAKVDAWINNIGGGYFNEMTNTLMLAEEVGEFSALINRTYGQQKFKKSEDRQNIKERLEDELGDVLFIVTCLANQLGINLDKVMTNNIKKKVSRDSDRYK